MIVVAKELKKKLVFINCMKTLLLLYFYVCMELCRLAKTAHVSVKNETLIFSVYEMNN